MTDPKYTEEELAAIEAEMPEASDDPGDPGEDTEADEIIETGEGE